MEQRDLEAPDNGVAYVYPDELGIMKEALIQGDIGQERRAGSATFIGLAGGGVGRTDEECIDADRFNLYEAMGRAAERESGARQTRGARLA